MLTFSSKLWNCIISYIRSKLLPGSRAWSIRKQVTKNSLMRRRQHKTTRSIVSCEVDINSWRQVLVDHYFCGDKSFNYSGKSHYLPEIYFTLSVTRVPNGYIRCFFMNMRCLITVKTMCRKRHVPYLIWLEKTIHTDKNVSNGFTHDTLLLRTGRLYCYIRDAYIVTHGTSVLLRTERAYCYVRDACIVTDGASVFLRTERPYCYVGDSRIVTDGTPVLLRTGRLHFTDGMLALLLTEHPYCYVNIVPCSIVRNHDICSNRPL